MRGEGRAAPPREHGLNALRVHYRCRDGRWLLLSIAADEWRWEKLKECLAASALDDPRFATVALRETHTRELIRILDEIFATRDQAEWRAILDAAGLIFGIVADMDEIADMTSRSSPARHWCRLPTAAR